MFGENSDAFMSVGLDLVIRNYQTRTHYSTFSQKSIISVEVIVLSYY